MQNNKVRVRFAPSPTGPLHIGGVRTALYNYLFAKKNNGTFILRIEDTDQTRFVKGAEKYIVESLQWCGIEPDESCEKNGKYGPYRQSNRKEIYKKYIQQLLDSGHAYYAFDTPEELDAMRQKLEAEKAENTSYCSANRLSMKNSLSLPANEITKYIDAGKSYVIRFKMPENNEMQVNDIIRGTIKFNTNTLDDKILFKSDGMPTYHLANVVDDHLMEISHVIRGEEWLPSLPLHFLLYQAFGWENETPQFAHLPLLLKPAGKGKLSKRDGDKLGFPVFPAEWKNEDGTVSMGYKENGYYPEAFINMLALLGWNPGTEQEIFSLKELANSFSLERVNKSGARFNPDKAKWFNHYYLQQQADDVLAKECINVFLKNNIKSDIDTIKKIIPLVKERLNFPQDIIEQANFFFVAPEEYDEKAMKKKWKPESTELLTELIEELNKLNTCNKTELENCIKPFIEAKGVGFGLVMIPLRIALVGATKGPDLFEIISILGIKESINRIIKAIDYKKNNL